MIRVRLLPLVFLGVVHAGCDICGDSSALSPELVMRQGTRIEASLDSSIAITAGERYDRRYEWGNCALESNMCPRRSRWHGSLGIYDPAPGFIYFFGGCDGISRPVVEEGQLNFADEAAAELWLQLYESKMPGEVAWTPTGLLVHWLIVPQREQLNVDVFQLCVNGERPLALKGGDDSSIMVSTAAETGEPLHGCVHTSASAQTDTMDSWMQHWQEVDQFRERRKSAREQAQ